jgi:hypothetical protein
MTSNTNYLSDLRKHLDAIPFGDTTVGFKKHDNKLVEMTLNTVETSKHPTNDEYLKDFILFVRALESNHHSGKVTLELDLKRGTINTLGYHTETKKEYRK